MNEWCKIKNKAESVDIYISGDICDDAWKCEWYSMDNDVFPSDVKNILNENQDKPINVHINSGGGHVFAGTAISNYLSNHKGATTAYIDGLAGSIASVIACGCDKVVIPANAFFMIHKPSCYVGGNSDDFRKMADVLDTIQDGIEKSYDKHRLDTVTQDTIHEMVNEETWLTGTECAKYFDFEVADALQAVACVGEKAKELFNKYKVESIVNVTNKPKESCEEVINEDTTNMLEEIENYLYLKEMCKC